MPLDPAADLDRDVTLDPGASGSVRLAMTRPSAQTTLWALVETAKHVASLHRKAVRLDRHQQAAALRDQSLAIECLIEHLTASIRSAKGVTVEKSPVSSAD
jgi:hypothetical protein